MFSRASPSAMLITILSSPGARIRLSILRSRIRTGTISCSYRILSLAGVLGSGSAAAGAASATAPVSAARFLPRSCWPLLAPGPDRLGIFFPALSVWRFSPRRPCHSLPNASPHRRHTRDLLPSAANLTPMRTGALQRSQSTMTLEISSGASLSTIPPGLAAPRGFVWRLTILSRSTITRPRHWQDAQDLAGFTAVASHDYHHRVIFSHLELPRMLCTAPIRVPPAPVI